MGPSSEPIRLPGMDVPATFAEYAQALASGAELRAGETLARTWELSLDLLAGRGQPRARPLLRLLSTFAHAPVPAELLDARVLAKTEVFAEITPQQLADLVEGLRGLGLVDYRANDLVLHPLVREANLRRAAEYEDVRLLVVDQAVAGLDPADTDTGSTWHKFLPHGVHLPDSAVDVHLVAALFCVHADLPAEAEALYRRAVRVSTARFGENHRETLFLRHNLALMARQRGDEESAETELRAVLAAQQRTLGPDHPDTRRAGQPWPGRPVAAMPRASRRNCALCWR